MNALTILIASMTLVGALALLLAVGFSLAGSGKPKSPILRRGLGAWTQTLCPQSNEVVEVELGVEEGNGPPTLGIYRCSYFGADAPTCGQTCLEWRSAPRTAVVGAPVALPTV